MALPAQSGPQLYKPQKGQKATKLACHTHVPTLLSNTHTHSLYCLLAKQLSGQGRVERGKQ